MLRPTPKHPHVKVAISTPMLRPRQNTPMLRVGKNGISASFITTPMLFIIIGLCGASAEHTGQNYNTPPIDLTEQTPYNISNCLSYSRAVEGGHLCSPCFFFGVRIQPE